LAPPDVGLKCSKIDFGWGSAPDPTGGAYSAPPDPLAREEGKGRERKGEGNGKEGRGGGERPYTLLVANSWLRHCFNHRDLCYRGFKIIIMMATTTTTMMI